MCKYGWLPRPAHDRQRVDSTVSTPPLLRETMWYCTSFLGREIARHPPAPGHTTVGGSRLTRKFVSRIFHFSRRKNNVAMALRCAGFKPLLIEIIAGQKVRRPLSHRIEVAGWIHPGCWEGYTKKGRETGPPDRGCRILFSQLGWTH
jgi:hypothetical protein